MALSLSPGPRNVELGYAEITSSFSGTAASTTDQDVTGLSVTVTVGSRPIMVCLDGSRAQNSGTGGWTLKIKEGTTTLGRQDGNSAAAIQGNPTRHIRLNPSAGTHTYKITIACTTANGTPTLVAQATDPASISVIEV